MHTAVVGAGPTGLYTAIALARRGHEVTVIDRDPGPHEDGSWNRRGVMQFHHPHGFGQQVVDALLAEMPEVWDDGRGVATSLMQAQRLIGLLDDHRRDLTSCSLEFDHWCEDNIKPWFCDHVYWDAELIRRWSGHDVDLTRPLPSDLIMAATAVDPAILKVVGPYMAMLALPASLAAVEPRAREIYASGWRPPVPGGPTRDELAALVTSVSARNGEFR